MPIAGDRHHAAAKLSVHRRSGSVLDMLCDRLADPQVRLAELHRQKAAMATLHRTGKLSDQRREEIFNVPHWIARQIRWPFKNRPEVGNRHKIVPSASARFNELWCQVA